MFWLPFSVFRPSRSPGCPPREGFKSDNGNLIIDCRGLTITDPPRLEADLNQIAGVVTNGLFARRPADLLLLAEAGGVRALTGRKA